MSNRITERKALKSNKADMPWLRAEQEQSGRVTKQTFRFRVHVEAEPDWKSVVSELLETTKKGQT